MEKHLKKISEGESKLNPCSQLHFAFGDYAPTLIAVKNKANVFIQLHTHIKIS